MAKYLRMIELYPPWRHTSNKLSVLTARTALMIDVASLEGSEYAVALRVIARLSCCGGHVCFVTCVRSLPGKKGFGGMDRQTRRRSAAEVVDTT